MHGGIVQGIGPAFGEHAVYDNDSGQLLTGSFMDYAMPRAGDLPFCVLDYNEPATSNSLASKARAKPAPRRATRGHQRHRRRAQSLQRRAPYRYAGDTAEGVGGDERPPLAAS